jgi:hypothetical protein
VIERIGHKINAKFGKITENINFHIRQLDIDLRVGSPKLDNTRQIRGHVDFGSSATTTTLPLEDDELVIRSAI